MLNSQVQEWPVNRDCTTLSHWSPANCKGRFQISPHSAGSFCCFWHCQSSDPPVHPLIAGHHWDSTSLVESYLTGRSFRVAWGGRYPKHINWSLGFPQGWVLGPFLFSTYTTSLGPSYRHMASPTIATTPMTPALSLFSTRWSNGSCTNLRLPGGHLGMDERTSPTAQPGKDWASCRPCHSDSTAWLLDSVRHINNYHPINFGQKSWCNLWWPADLQRPHCKDLLDLAGLR